MGSRRHRSRRLVALGAAAAIFAGLGSAGPARAAAPAGNAGVTGNVALGSTAAATPDFAFSPVRGRDNPALVADPANPRHFVMVNEDFLANQCEFHVTFDGGKNWTGGNLTTPADFAQPPCRTFDSGGYAHFDGSVVFGSGQNVYTTFASHRGLQERPESKVVQGEGDSLMVSHSTDGGRTFQTATVAIQGGPGPQPYLIRPGVAVAPGANGDKLYVIGWRVFLTSGGALSGGGERSLITSASTDSGATWSAPLLANTPGELVREPTQPVVGPDGAVYVGWRDRNDAPAVNHIVVARSADGGATWTRSEAGLAAAAGVTSGGGYPRLAIDPHNGALYLVFQGADASGTNISLQRSTDQGATWSDPVVVNDDAKATGVPHNTPQVSVAPNGRVNVLWLDLRNSYPTPISAKASGLGDIFWAGSSDGGKTFSTNRRITDRSINMNAGLIGRIGSYTWYGPAEVVTDNNAVTLAWADPRLGNVDTDTQDLFLSTLQVDAAGPPPVQTMPTRSHVDESVALSKLAYPGGSEEIGGSGRSKVVVVNESDAGAALAGAVLARASFGPLLLAPAGGLTKALRDEIGRLRPTGAFLIGNQAQLSAQVEKDLQAAGVKDKVERISGATPAATAAAVATAVAADGPDAKFTKAPATAPSAVVVNPSSPDAAAGVALAAALRDPILFVGPSSVPTETAQALRSLAATSTLVVGGPSEISDAVVGQLPAAKRLGGNDATATSGAVAAESVAKGLPVNVVYVTNQSATMDGAVLGAAAARLGGLLVTAPGGDATTATATLDRLHLTPAVDRLVVARSAQPHRSPGR